MDVEEKTEAAGAIRQDEQRAHPRFPVDEDSVLLVVARNQPRACRILDLSLTGCRLRALEPFSAFAHARVEVAFKINGIAFRFPGVIQWTDGQNLAGVRFVNIIPRRQEELAEVIGEVEAITAARAQEQAAEKAEAEKRARKLAETQAREGAAPEAIAPPASVHLSPSGDRSGPARHEVDTSAAIFLAEAGYRLEGRILDLSVSDCCIRTAERVLVSIHTRVETELCLDGFLFRLSGVIQAIHDRNTVGIRFLDMSERKREQVEELMKEIEEMQKDKG
jgi:hypothetical protein